MSEIGAHSDWISAARREIENCESSSAPPQRLSGAGEAPPAELLAALGLALPGYEIREPLARGGQGLVLRAVQRATRRDVAIKVLRGGALGTSQSRLRFDREVQILAQLKHPNVVSIIDSGSAAGHDFFIMDYVRGSSLLEFVREHKLDVRSTLALFAKLCDALGAAHLRGIIHRDLKPANIRVDPSGAPHVLDFGLAKVNPDDALFGSSAEQTQTGQFLGSLHYAAPEQFRGTPDEVDLRTDVYALGVMLYQALTDALPHNPHGPLHTVIERIVRDEPVPPGQRNPALRGDADAIVRKCLAKDPEQRYQSAGELARELRRFLAGEPIEARRDSLVYLTTRRLARYRAAALGGTVALLAVSAALLAAVWFWRAADQQRNLALRAADRATREADQARAAFDFIRDVLTSVEPENDGADVRLTKVLADAARTTPERFADHPLLRAQLHALLGETYDKLGMWNDAEPQLRAAVELNRAHAGTDDPRTLHAESAWVGTLLNLSKYAEAEAELTALLPRLARVLGADAREMLAARRAFAIAQMIQGRVDEAEATLRALRAHPALQQDDAMQIRLAKSLMDVITWRAAAAGGRPESGALAEREALAREWIDRAARSENPDSILALQAPIELAHTLTLAGRPREAIPLCRELLEGRGARLPECHDLRAWAMAVLAEALGRTGEVEQPADLFVARVECLRKAGRSARASLLSAISGALEYLERAGRAAQGEALAIELRDAMRAFGVHAVDGPDLLLARFQSQLGRLDEADASFAALAARESELSDELRARLRLYRALHHIRRQRFSDAQRDLADAAALTGGVDRGTRSTHPDDLLLGYIELFDATGDAQQSAEYRRRRAALLE